MSRKKLDTRSTWRSLGGYLLFFAGLWLLWDTPVVLPLKVFVVFLHEISHGIAAVATGGRIDRIVLSADQGGACYCGGGSAFLTLSAGYLGSLLWGLTLIGLARFEKRSRLTMAAAGVGTALVTVFFVRSAFGFVFGLAAGALLIFASRRLPARWNARILAGIGMTSALYAILDIKSDVISRSSLPSDARMLEELTGVPTLVWGFLWMTLAVGLVILVLHRSIARLGKPARRRRAARKAGA